MIDEYYIDKKIEGEYSDIFKRKITIIWKGDKYSTFIQSEYLDDKIITLDDLEEFFDSVFNKKKFYNLDVSSEFYFWDINTLQLNIRLEIKINDKLKPLKQDYSFFLNKENKKTWFNWIKDIIFNSD